MRGGCARQGTSGVLDDDASVLCAVQLILGLNHISDAGVAELAKALVVNRTLTRVRCVHVHYAWSH